MHYLPALEKLKKGSKLYLECKSNHSIFHQDLSEELKNKGQKTYATIINFLTQEFQYNIFFPLVWENYLLLEMREM